MRFFCQWRAVMVAWCCHLATCATPDGTGLVGSAPEMPALPLKFWANPRKSALKPRRRDLHEPSLLRLMGPDFDSRWMRRAQRASAVQPPPDEERQTVRALRELAARTQLPASLSPELRATVADWLVSTAACAVRYDWSDLGAYFWPRWLRSGECAAGEGKSCSWPPGMRCVPGVARTLHILRWHCRLRKTGLAAENNVWGGEDRLRRTQERRKKRRRKYRCQWLKVPYPVPQDCVCAC